MRRRRAAGRGAGARPSSGVPALARRRLTGVAPQAGTVAVAVAAVAAGDEAGDVGVLIRSGLVVHAARDDDAAAAAAARRAAGALARVAGADLAARAAVDAAAAAHAWAAALFPGGGDDALDAAMRDFVVESR